MPGVMDQAEALAQRYGTPLWVLDEGEIAVALSGLQRAFNGVHIGLASKAIGWPEAVRVLAPKADSIMATGSHELSILLGARVPAPLVTWWGSGRTREEFSAALNQGIGDVVLDSEREIKEFLEASHNRCQLESVLVRVAPVHCLGRPGYERFGLPLGSALTAVKRLARCRIGAVGLAYHADVQSQSPAAWARCRNSVLKAMQECEVGGVRLVCDLGGGLPPRSLLGPAGFGAYSKLLRQPPNVALRLCIGRAAIADAGSVVCKVVEVKRVSSHRWVFVDAGANLLVPLKSARFAAEAIRQGRKSVSRVADRSNSFGVIDGYARLPTGIRPGDILVVRRAGAYTWSMRCAAVEGCGTALLVNRKGKVLLQSTR